MSLNLFPIIEVYLEKRSDDRNQALFFRGPGPFSVGDEIEIASSTRLSNTKVRIKECVIALEDASQKFILVVEPIDPTAPEARSG